jgi:hypothetical protein
LGRKADQCCQRVCIWHTHVNTHKQWLIASVWIFIIVQVVVKFFSLTEPESSSRYSLQPDARPSHELGETSPNSGWWSCRRSETVSLNCGHQRTHFLSRRWYMSMEIHGVMILTGENRRTRIKTYPSSTLSTKNPTCSGGPRSNLGQENGYQTEDFRVFTQSLQANAWQYLK